jgi:hypothetical protein
LAAALFGTAFRLASFLAVPRFFAPRFFAGCFAGDFLPAFFRDLADFFPDFFLVAIRAV